MKICVQSNNTRLLPVENIQMSGEGLVRTLCVTPIENMYGNAKIELTGLGT